MKTTEIEWLITLLEQLVSCCKIIETGDISWDEDSGTFPMNFNDKEFNVTISEVK